MREVLAHVAARIVPAAVHVTRLAATVINAKVGVPPHNGRVHRTVVVEVVEHRTERLFRESILFDLERVGRCGLAVFGYLQRVRSGRDTPIEHSHVELAVVRPVVRIRSLRKRSRLDGIPARHQLEFGAIELGIALDDDADGHTSVVADLVVVEVRGGSRNGKRQGKGDGDIYMFHVSEYKLSGAILQPHIGNERFASQKTGLFRFRINAFYA